MKVQTPETPSTLTMPALDQAIEKAKDHLLARQHPDGYWCFTLEADTTLTSEYLMMSWFLGKGYAARAAKAAHYLWSRQNSDGGWPIYFGGPSNVSATVKAYLALKLAGISPDDPRLRQIRDRVLALGGVEACNVFTLYQLALLGQFPWEKTPSMPIEIIHLPRWFYFNLQDVSYWSRTVMIPHLVLAHFRLKRKLPKEFEIDELFLNPASKKSNWNQWSRPLFSWKNFFLAVDKAVKLYERSSWKPWQKRSLNKIKQWILSHIDKGGGLGAIFPAMMNSVLALRCLGFPDDSPEVKSQWEEVEKLAVETETQFFLQPCFSPVWDTAISLIALTDAGLRADHPAMQRGAEWLLQKEIQTPGDWKAKCPGAQPGGWYFQFWNEYYADVDDTGMVLLALERVKLSTEGEARKQATIDRALKWLAAMQSDDGGWGAFDKNNNKLKLNNIPFADHGALLDPSTADVTARVLEAMARQGLDKRSPTMEQAFGFLLGQQEKEGCWFGRWGANYIYGTWSVLSAFETLGLKSLNLVLKRAAAWLHSVQNPDGGWGESQFSYGDPATKGKGKSTASQTAWGLMALLLAGESVSSDSIERALKYLLETQTAEGTWQEEEFTGTGFPKVFCLRYHGYRHYFPLAALGRAYQRWSSSLKESSIPG